MIIFLVALIGSLVFFSFFRDKKEQPLDYWKYQAEADKQQDIFLQSIEDSQMDYKIDYEVRRRIEQHKKRLKFVEETKGMDGCEMHRYARLNELGGIHIMNPFEFSQTVHDIDTWRYKDVNIMELIDIKANQAILLLDLPQSEWLENAKERQNKRDGNKI